MRNNEIRTYCSTIPIKDQNFKLGDTYVNIYSDKIGIVTEQTLKNLQFCINFAFGCSYYKKIKPIFNY